MDRWMKVTKSRLEQIARKGERTDVSVQSPNSPDIKHRGFREWKQHIAMQKPLSVCCWAEAWLAGTVLLSYLRPLSSAFALDLGAEEEQQLLSRDVKSLWILHHDPLGTHFWRNEKTEGIASTMLSSSSLESKLQPDCEIRGFGIETWRNTITKYHFYPIISFNHCLQRASGHQAGHGQISYSNSTSFH